MDCTVDSFRARFERPWMLDDAPVRAVFEQHVVLFKAGDRVLILETQPAQFWGKFLAALAQRATIFLGLTQWSDAMRREAHDLMKSPVETSLEGFVLIPTGGSGGALKWAYHNWGSLRAAVWGLSRALGFGEIHAMAALPLGHVSGFMPGLRSWITGGHYGPLENKVLDAGDFPTIDRALRWQLSVVPTQLERWLHYAHGVAWLRQFDCIWIGGTRLPDGLADKTRVLGIPLAPCYGMTETAAMVLIQKPKDFLENTQARAPLPHGHLVLDGAPGGWCRVGLSFESLFDGYFPDRPKKEPIFWTQDEIELDERYNLGRLRRVDRILITGGEKVDPQMIEDVLLTSGYLRDVFVCGQEDAQWGERVVAYWVPHADVSVDEHRLRTFVRSKLSAFQCPKQWLRVEQIPHGIGRKLAYRGL